MLPTALRNSAFARLWLASSISSFGSMMTFIALPLVAYELTGSGAAFGSVMAAGAAGNIVALLIGGALADRFDRRALLVWGDALLLVVVLAMGAAVHARVWPALVALAFLDLLVTTLFRSAAPALQRDIVGEQERMQASAAMSFSANASQLIAPIVGAALYATAGFGVVVVVDALTFLVSLVLVVTVRDPAAAERRLQAAERRAAGMPLRAVVRDIRHGLVLAGSDRFLRRSFAAGMSAGAGNACFLVAALPWLIETHDARPELFGVMVSVIGGAGIATALIVGRLGERLSEAAGMRAAAVSLAVGGAGFLLPLPLEVVFVTLVAFGSANVLLGVVGATVRQRRFGSGEQGRIVAAERLAFEVPSLLALVAASAVVGTVGPAPLVGAFGTLMLIGAGWELSAARYLSRHGVARVADPELAVSA